GWPLQYYKHIITPLPFEEVVKRDDREELLAIRQSLAHLEINGPNTIIGTLPDHTMWVVCDAKKLRPIVVGRTKDTVAFSSEVCGINEILPDRNWEDDIYPNEREIVVVDNNLEVQRWKQ
ncbi:glutamate synthase, partial [bacterium]